LRIFLSILALGAPEARATFGDHLLLDDPWLPAQWPLENTGTGLWPVQCLSLPPCIPTLPGADIDWGMVYDAGFTGAGVTIAIGTPTGVPTVWCDDPELAGRVVPGWNFVTNTAAACRPTAPGDWHDTIVARLAVGTANNGFAGVGVAPRASLMPIVWEQDVQNKVFYQQVLPFLGTNGARAIVVPYAGVPVEITGSPTLACSQVATAYGLNRATILANSNVLVLWGQPLPDVGNPVPDAHYPTCDPSALGVAHTDQNDVSLVSASPFVDIAAPGSRPDGDSIATSWALGITAGAAALLLHEDPSLSRAALVDRLRNSAKDLGAPGPDPSYGAGRLDVLRALLLGDPDGDGVPGDENCPFEFNPGQEDTGGVGGAGPPNGRGDACECGDLSGEGWITGPDVLAAREQLAGLPYAGDAGRCNVVGEPGGAPGTCILDDVVALARALAGLPATLEQICAPALP
jgi:hypothetical protein